MINQGIFFLPQAHSREYLSALRVILKLPTDPISSRAMKVEKQIVGWSKQRSPLPSELTGSGTWINLIYMSLHWQWNNLCLICHLVVTTMVFPRTKRTSESSIKNIVLRRDRSTVHPYKVIPPGLFSKYITATTSKPKALIKMQHCKNGEVVLPAKIIIRRQKSTIWKWIIKEMSESIYSKRKRAKEKG